MDLLKDLIGKKVYLCEEGDTDWFICGILLGYNKHGYLLKDAEDSENKYKHYVVRSRKVEDVYTEHDSIDEDDEE